MTPEKKERSSGGQVETAWMVRLKRIWHWCSAERVQATGTAIIALVTTWTLFFTPLGERLVSEINQTVRETQQELEHHRTVATKVTLRALWRVADKTRGLGISSSRWWTGSRGFPYAIGMTFPGNAV